jgi:hypothetical protein
VTEAYGESGHIWRAIYAKSNSAQDLVVTGLPEPSRELQRAIRHARVQGVIGALTWPIGLLAGLAAWVTAWRVTMPRQPGVLYHWREGKLYRDALIWAVLYPITILVALLPAGLMCLVREPGYWTWHQWVLVVVIPLGLLAALGPVSAFLYARWKAHSLQVSRRQAFGAYMSAMLLANFWYLVFAAVYYVIVGAI